MRGIFFVSTPLQLLNAIEAKHFFKLDHSSLVILWDSKNALEQQHIRSVLDLVKWDRIIFLDRKKKFKIFHFSKIIKQLKKEKFEYLFVGYISLILSQIFLSNISAKYSLALDDGTTTIYIQRQEAKKLSGGERFRAFRYQFLGLSFHYLPIVNSFTSFNFLPNHKNQKLITHNYSFLKSLIKKGIKKSEYIYFIGVPLLAVNTISKNTFVDLLKKIQHYYKEKKQKVLYIPHRRESEDDLKLVPFEKRRVNRPLELEFILGVEQPTALATFFSSVFFNLHHIASNVATTSFVIEESLLMSKKEETLGIYKDMKENLDIQFIEPKDL